MKKQNKDLEIIKLILQEEEKKTDSVETFEDNPMEFILRKYTTLDEVLKELMTPSYREYLDAVFIAAPKPTTFKVILHNGQHFFLTYMGKVYEATVSGKKYYLSNIGEKERCMLAISRLLRGGSPIKSKGPDGAEQGTREDSGSTGGEGGETPPAEGGEEVGGEELTESLFFREITKAVLKEVVSADKKNTQLAIDKIINSPEGKKYNFIKQSNWKRLGNLDKISEDGFKKIISKVFKTKDIKVYGPGKGGNPSNTFNMYSFNTKEGPVSIVLSAGKNKGQDYEDNIFAKMRDSAGKDIDEIEDEEVKQIFDAVNVNPKELSPEDIKSTGKNDTKRSLSADGPKDVGEKIADIQIKPTNTNISIKDKTGSGFYNGGIVPFIVNKNGKAAYDPSKKGNNPIIEKIFDLLNIDPLKVAKGLNQYIKSKGIVKEEDKDSSGYENANISDPKIIKNLLASGFGYGYYYVRQKKDGVFVRNIATKEDAEEMVGNVTSVQIKYPGPSTKILTVKINVKSKVFGDTYYKIEMRNDKSNVLPLSLKMKSQK
jgi:hypothetical protein